MAKETLKVVIPMAGLGSRLRPHTWSKPKQLMTLAGATVIDHVLNTLNTLPDPGNIELINIIGYLGDQIETYIRQKYPHLTAHFVEQPEMRGQSHAIHLAKDLLSGPMLMVFADTLMDANFSFLANEQADGVAWVKAVPDPRRFGVAEVNANGRVTRLVEKPQDMSNNLVVVGCYYFRSSEDLIAAIEEQMRRNIQLKGEFFLADAVNIMLESGMHMRTQPVETWLDAGTPEAMLESNRYLLDHGLDNSSSFRAQEGVTIIPPVNIHPSAALRQSVIGPHVSIAANCVVENAVVQDCILEDSAQVRGLVLAQSLIGRSARVDGRPQTVNVGDNSQVTL